VDLTVFPALMAEPVVRPESAEMTATRDDVSKKIKQEPTAEQLAAEEESARKLLSLRMASFHWVRSPKSRTRRESRISPRSVHGTSPVAAGASR
jgi:hypothetical protein